MPEHNKHDGGVDAKSGHDSSASSPSVDVSPDQPSGQPTQRSPNLETPTEIEKLNRKVVVTWIVAAFGPLLALAGLVFTGLQWKAAHEQVAIMHEQLKDARDGAAQARRDTDAVISAAKSQAESLKILAETNRAVVAAAERQAEAGKSAARSMQKSAEQNRRAADAMEQSAGAAVRSAENSKRLTEISEESFQASQRSWVTVRHVRFTRLTVGDTPGADLSINNSGRSPAIEVSLYSAVVVSERLERDDMRPAELPSTSNFVVAPGLQIEYHPVADDPIKDLNDLGDFRSGKSKVWVYGYIRYKDRFGDHETKFCFWTGGRYFDAGTAIGCAEHNEAN